MLASTGPSVNAPLLAAAVVVTLLGVGLLVTGTRMRRTKP
jgi:hypothetical protein